MKATGIIACFLLISFFSAAGQTVIPMQNGKVRVCKGTFTDSDLGKTTGYYDHNENYTLKLCVPGASSITLKFTAFCTEKDNDVLRIFDGKDTFATLLGTWSGNKSPGTIKSSDSCLTIHFISDKSVACTGWEATISTVIIPPKAPKLSMFQSAKCNDNYIMLTASPSVPCDSIKVANATMTGPITIAAVAITAQNCSGGLATKFKIDLSKKLDLNGNYSFKVKTYYKDFCDSVYELVSTVNFSVADCPLKVVLTADADTICKGTCTYLRTSVSGGNPAKYIYAWTPAGLNGAGPLKVCPTSDTRYILKVTDGISIPSSDTVDVVVLDPPQTMADTDVCYYGSNFFVRANPAGGKWYGKGIINSSTGEFKPFGNYGNNKIWYQVGSCADTMLVNVTIPWNLENQFCPGTAPAAVWWYSPAGGTWSGPKISPAGIFTPDVPGIYKDTYTWKGCISVKTILVEDIVVKKFDTACESTTLDTLQFSPYGIYPNWFPGLLNSYYQWVNPSQMGGPGNKMIIWNGGGCKDTTMYTILESKAGPTDTFCPDAGVQILKNYRPTSGYTWSGHGITDSSKSEYNPGFFYGLGKASFRDTLTIKSAKCSSSKYVYLYPTIIGKKDTLFFCFETPATNLNNLAINLSPKGGKWNGAGITANAIFTAANAGYGNHMAIYTVNGCSDTIPIFVRPKPVVQTDTTVCITSSTFQCYAANSGGNFAGKGITNGPSGVFNPSVAGRGTWPITYTSKEGCKAFFQIKIDTVPVIWFTNSITDFCFRDTLIDLNTNLAGGSFTGDGVVGKQFQPALAGSGSHKILYEYKSGSCTATASLDVIVADTLTILAVPGSDTICPGETVWLRSFGSGGDNSNYKYEWSNNQSGSGTFVSPKSTTIYTVTLTDGCSNPAMADVPIYKHPNPWFDVKTSPPLCFGLNGYAKISMKDNDPYSYYWDIAPPFTGDSLVAAVGNTYRLTATNLRTGCQSDTSVEIPGYQAIQAGFIANIQGGEKCVTNIFPDLRIFNTGQGGTTGTWYWGDGTQETFDPNINPTHTYNGDQNYYKIKLVVLNAGGCIDSTELTICFRDTVVVYIPNTFTPNGDNRNEVFLPIANGANRYELAIFNRWGQKLFETTDPKQGWDGRFNGKDCPEGVYAYSLIYKGRKSITQLKQGSLILLRTY